MILKNYEKTALVTVLVYFIIIVEIGLYLFFSKTKITDYLELSTIVVDKNEVRVIADNSARKTLYNNSVLYIDDKKEKYSIVLDNGILWQKNKTKYYEMYLNIKLENNYKSNDIINVSIAKKKTNLIEAIIKTWGGE